MGTGPRFPITDRSGFLQLVTVGRPIAPDAGFGSHIGDGPGFRMSPGAGRRITTAAGCIGEVRGYGGRGRCMGIATIVRSGRPRMFPSSVSDTAALVSRSAVGGDRLAGCRLAHVTASTRGGE